MARIRSVHPGLFTDEAFMQASPNARLMLIGIWTEAWDDGVFEWKPVVLKARIFPADNIDSAALLDELEALNVIRCIECNGKRYGLIRNFCKYQRPKKPNSSGLLPNDCRKYVGMTDLNSEPVPNQFRTSSENPSQMEDGGWRMDREKEKDSKLASSCASEEGETRDRKIYLACLKASGWASDKAPSMATIHKIRELVDAGHDLEKRICPVIATKSAEMRKFGKDPPDRWDYFAPVVADPTFKPSAGVLPVETVEVREGDVIWARLVASGKRESLLRSLLKPASNGKGQAVYYPKSEIERLSA